MAKRQLKMLAPLSAEEFRHPRDAKATDALKRLPGLDTLLSKIMEYGLERVYYVENIASNIRVTSTMLPKLHRSLTWACKILDVAEPELYVKLDPIPNAFTYGHTKPFITLTTGLSWLANRFFSSSRTKSMRSGWAMIACEASKSARLSHQISMMQS